MLKAILFDLDGTLLPLDTDRFVHEYTKSLAAHVGHLIPPRLFVEQLLAASRRMIEDTDPSRTNAQVFADHFYTAVGIPEPDLLPVFERYYEQVFPSLSAVGTGLPGPARVIVQAAIDQGYEIVLASNPVFPRVAALERMRWAAIDDLPWRLVTTYEEMHAAKPQPAYYHEIVERLGHRPEECLMVGNDLDEDGVAAKVGMHIFIVTDHLINRQSRPLPVERSGTMAEFGKRLLAGKLP